MTKMKNDLTELLIPTVELIFPDFNISPALFCLFFVNCYFVVDFRWASPSWSTSASIHSTATTTDAPCNYSSSCSYPRSSPNGTSCWSTPTIPPSTLPAYAAAWIHALSVRELFTPGWNGWSPRRVSWICTSLTPWLLLRGIWHATAARISPSRATAPTGAGTIPWALTSAQIFSDVFCACAKMKLVSVSYFSSTRTLPSVPLTGVFRPLGVEKG